MARPISRRVVIGVRTACAATAARWHRGSGSVPTFGSGETMAVYETSPGWRRGTSSPAGVPAVMGAAVQASASARQASLLYDRNGNFH
jgi:hypothetical protein